MGPNEKKVMTGRRMESQNDSGSCYLCSTFYNLGSSEWGYGTKIEVWVGGQTYRRTDQITRKIRLLRTQWPTDSDCPYSLTTAEKRTSNEWEIQKFLPFLLPFVFCSIHIPYGFFGGDYPWLFHSYMIPQSIYPSKSLCIFDIHKKKSILKYSHLLKNALSSKPRCVFVLGVVVETNDF